MSFLDELKRRKVIRAVLAYGAVAFAVAQGATTFFPVLRMPDWTVTTVVVLCLIGLPITAVVAWAFEVTEAGIVRADLADTVAPRTRSRPIIAGLVIVICLGLGGAFAWRRARDHDPSLDPALIAVLPFRVSADASLGYLREGMVDLLASTLAIENGSRAADARAVMSAWRRTVRDEKSDLPPDSALEVARAVGAGRVLLGSIVGTPAQFTVTAEIFILPYGARRAHAQASGASANLTTLVDSLTAQLLSLDAGEQENRLESLTSTSLEALKSYLAGQAAFRRARFSEAAAHFDKAVELDSSFALAAVGIQLALGWGDVRATNEPRADRLARNHRTRLAAADRAFVEALVGRDGQPRSIADRMNEWSQYVGKYPDRADAWFQYADLMFHGGGFIDFNDYSARASQLFARSLALDSSFAPALVHLIDINGVFNPDRQEFHRLTNILERMGVSKEVAAYQYPERVYLSGDSAAIRMFRQSLDTLPLFYHTLMAFYWRFGVGTADDVERAIQIALRRAASPSERSAVTLAAHDVYLNMGRPQAARRVIQELQQLDPSIGWHERLVLDAMFWDGDTAAARVSAQRLNAEVQRTGNDSPNPDRKRAACTLGQWRLRQQDNTDYDRLLALLQSPVPDGTTDAPAQLCVTMLRALREAGTRPAAAPELVRLDSLATAGYGGYRLLRQANATLVALYGLRGQHDSAKRAAHRTGGNEDWAEYNSVWLRDAGRLALATGDTARAIQHWTTYLKMRVRPEPEAVARDDLVRRQLEQLTRDRRN